VPDDEPKEVTDKYFVVPDALVSKLKLNAKGQIEIDPNDPARARVALLGIHVVAVLDGHPEFVWATFEHSDNAPDGLTNPDNTANQNPDKPIDTKGKEYLLYKKGTIASECNTFNSTDIKNLKLDEKTQRLSPPSRVFRLFPFGEDDCPFTIQDLNDSVHRQIVALEPKIPKAQFDQLAVWKNYDLKGAIWLNNPAYFREGVDIKGTPEEYEKDTKKIFGGDKKLSNTTMESFTQGDFDVMKKPRLNNSCFHCHDTQDVTPDSNQSFAPIVYPGKRIGISHIVTAEYFLAHEKFNLQIQQLETDLAAAVTNNPIDSVAVGRFLAKDFISIDPKGGVESKKQFLAELTQGTLKFASIKPSAKQDSWTIDVGESTAVVTYKAAVKATHNGADTSGSYRFTDIFKNQSGRWVIISRQQSSAN
jgi:ketosteroid isomerase-like protein